jgi:hypothetical protein
MLSFDEILKRIIAFLRAKFPGVAFDEKTDIDQMFGRASEDLIREINDLPWVRSERIELRKSVIYSRTVTLLARELYGDQSPAATAAWPRAKRPKKKVVWRRKQKRPQRRRLPKR